MDGRKSKGAAFGMNEFGCKMRGGLGLDLLILRLYHDSCASRDEQVQQILVMSNQKISSEGSQSQRAKLYARTSKQQTKNRQLQRSQRSQYDREDKNKSQQSSKPDYPQSCSKGERSIDLNQSQTIQVQKDASSGNSSDPPELLGIEMQLLNCACTRCHREGQDNISTDTCAKDRIYQLRNQLQELKAQVRELSLIKEGLMAEGELQQNEVNLKERVKVMNEIIKRLKDTLVDMINRIRKVSFSEDPLSKEMTDDQLDNFCQVTASKCVQDLIGALQQLKDKSQVDETMNIKITDFPEDNQKVQEIRNEQQGSRNPIVGMQLQIKLKNQQLKQCQEQQNLYSESLIEKQKTIKEDESKENVLKSQIEQNNQSIQSLNNQISQKTNSLQKKDKELSALQKEHEFLLQKMRNLEEECQIKTQQLQNLQHSNKDLEVKHSTALKTLQEKQQQIDQHKSSSSKRQTLWFSQKITQQKLAQEQLQEKESQLQHLKELLEKIKQQNSQFKQTFTYVLDDLKKKSENDLKEQRQKHQKEMEEAQARYNQTITIITKSTDQKIWSHRQLFEMYTRKMKDEHIEQLTNKQNLNSQLQKVNQRLQANVQELETKICQFIKSHDDMLKFYNTTFGNFITTQRTKSLNDHNDNQSNYVTLFQTILTLEEENATLKNSIELLMKDYLNTLLISRTSALDIEELSLLNGQLSIEKEQLISSHNESTRLLQKKIEQIELAYNKSYSQMCQIQQNHYKQAVEAQTTVLNARIALLENQLRDQSEISTETARLSSCQQSFNKMEISELKKQLAAEKEIHQRTVRKYKNHKEELMDQVSRFEQTSDDFQNQKIDLEIKIKQYETLVERINQTVSNFLDQVGSQPLQVLLSAASSSFEPTIDSLYRLTNTINIFYEEMSVRVISVENKNSQLQSKFDSLSKQNSEIKSSARMNGESLAVKVKEAETKQNIVEKQLEQTNLDRQKLKSTMATAQRQLKQLRLKDKQSQKTIFQLSNKIKQFESSGSKQSNRLNAFIQQKTVKITQLTSKLTQIEEQRNQLRNQLDSITRENSKLKNETFILKQEERKSVSQSNKIKESEILLDQYLNQNIRTQQQNEKMQRKIQQYERQVADLKRKITENEGQIQSNRNTLESTISQKEHLSQIQSFKKIIQQQKMSIQRLERSSQSMITESVYNRKDEEMQQIIDKLQRQKANLEEKCREVQLGFKEEEKSSVSLTRMKSHKILMAFSPEESAFLNMFSSRTLLDLPQHQVKKELLMKTILERTGKQLKETSLSFAYSLKNRTFHTNITKAVLTNDESYVFLFNSKGKDNSSNIFAITIYKTGQKNVPILGLLTLLSKEGTFQKRKECSSTTLPISFDFTGTEITLGATIKIKSGDTKVRTQSQSRYFDMPNPFVVFDKQSKEVDLQNFQIHKIVLQ